jgi:hypothetical protein
LLPRNALTIHVTIPTEAISSNKVALKMAENFVDKQAFVCFRVVSQMRHGIVSYRNCSHFAIESPIFIIIDLFNVAATAATTTITYICTCLNVIRITTTVTQIKPIYFGIRVTMLNYVNICSLTNFTEKNPSHHAVVHRSVCYPEHAHW